MNNLFVSYDLNSPGQDYKAAFAAIEALGSAVRIQKSFWFVKSTLTAQQAVQRLWPHFDRNDSLFVVDATNKSAAWQGLTDAPAKWIQQNWNV